MAGQKREFAGVPFFWSDQFDTFLQYVGYAKDWEDIIFHGSPADRKLLAFYVKKDQVLAVAGLNHEKDMAAISELMGQKNMPAVEELRRGPVDWLARLDNHGPGKDQVERGGGDTPPRSACGVQVSCAHRL